MGQVAGAATSGPDGGLEVSVPAMSAAVLRAASARPPTTGPLTVSVTAAEPDGRGELRAQVDAPGEVEPFAQVTFVARPAGSAEGWTTLGTDDAPPYRVFPDGASLPEGALDVRAVVAPWQGEVAVGAATTTVVHGR